MAHLTQPCSQYYFGVSPKFDSERILYPSSLSHQSHPPPANVFKMKKRSGFVHDKAKLHSKWLIPSKATQILFSLQFDKVCEANTHSLLR